MSTSSILGGESAATRAAGRDTDALGPSDTSDSGSDVQGERPMPTDGDNPGELGSLTADLDSDSDAMGTGERGSATGDSGRDGGDILPDRIIDNGTVAEDQEDSLERSPGIDDIADDVDEDEDDGDSGDKPMSAGHVASETSHDGRVFHLPSGTLEETLKGDAAAKAG